MRGLPHPTILTTAIASRIDAPSPNLSPIGGEEHERVFLGDYSFVTVWNDLEMTCQRPSVLSSVR